MEMNENKPKESGMVRAYCMNSGTITGIICSISFLCSMFGLQHFILGQFSNLLALLALVMAGLSIRRFRREVTPVSFGRCCWMSIVIYFYAILLTALVQYAYFAWMDNGQLMMQMQKLLEMPEYRKMLEQMAGGENIEALEETALGIFQSPSRTTMQFMWMNCIISLIMTPLTALIGVTGGRPAKKQ